MINIKILCSVTELESIKGKHLFFHIIFLNMDFSITILDNAMKFCMALLHIHSEGSVSQILYLVFILCYLENKLTVTRFFI